MAQILLNIFNCEFLIIKQFLNESLLGKDNDPYLEEGRVSERELNHLLDLSKLLPTATDVVVAKQN